MKDKLQKYERQEVEVKAHGIIYRGVLMGADEDTLYLKMETGWTTLPLEAIGGIKRKGEDESAWVMKEVSGRDEGGPPSQPGKKHYSDKDLERIHQGERKKEWPEWDEEDEE